AALPQDRRHRHLCRGGGLTPLPTIFGHAARAPRPRERKFVGRSCPGFLDGRRENADPAAFWPSTGRGRGRTVAATCQDRHFGGGGGLVGRTRQPSTENDREPPASSHGLGSNDAWDPESARPSVHRS